LRENAEFSKFGPNIAQAKRFPIRLALVKVTRSRLWRITGTRNNVPPFIPGTTSPLNAGIHRFRRGECFKHKRLPVIRAEVLNNLWGREYRKAYRVSDRGSRRGLRLLLFGHGWRVYQLHREVVSPSSALRATP
jgi:hypothetical protein